VSLEHLTFCIRVVEGPSLLITVEEHSDDNDVLLRLLADCIPENVWVRAFVFTAAHFLRERFALFSQPCRAMRIGKIEVEARNAQWQKKFFIVSKK
jgi:hypothetical protein